MKSLSSLYRDQSDWRELQKFLPEDLHLGDSVSPEPDEEFWTWNGNRVHLDRYCVPDSKVRFILLHGVGTNGRQMNMILGSPLFKRGYDVTAIDNLGYGMTNVRKGFSYDYGDWVKLVLDYVHSEKRRDPRPIVLFGLSAGGMLAYHVAAADDSQSLAGIVGMTFLDQRNQMVRDYTAHDIVVSRLGVPLMDLFAHGPIGSLRIPMRLASKMSALANNKGAMRVFMRDKTSAGNSMSLRFLSTYMNYAPATEPEDFTSCPVLHTQPDKDRWTPYALSTPVTHRITHVPMTEVDLDNAGHYPLEDSGLRQLVDTIDAFAASL